jgi:hypothetical protein
MASLAIAKEGNQEKREITRSVCPFYHRTMFCVEVQFLANWGSD